MRIKNRIKKLEKIIAPDLPKYHLVIAKPDGSDEEAIEQYKAENKVGPDDKIFVIQYISSIERIKNDPK